MDYKTELKPPVEARYREELEALQALDTDRKPLNWKLSPKAVRTFILGSREPLFWNGREIRIRKKYLADELGATGEAWRKRVERWLAAWEKAAAQKQNPKTGV